MADEAPIPEVPAVPAPVPQTAGQKLAQTLAADTPPLAESVESAKPTFAERLKAEFGFEGVDSDEQAQERLIEAWKRDRDSLASERQRAEEQARIAVALAAGQPAAPVAQTEPVNDHWWKPPTIDERLLEAYQTSTVDAATGREKIGWREGTPPEVIAKYNALEAHTKQWTEDLVRRPHEVLPKIIAYEARRIVQEELSQTQAAQQAETFLDTFRRENTWLYDADPVTNKPAITSDGRLKLSAEGQKFQAYLNEAESLGIADVQKQFTYANRLRAAEVAAAKAQPSAHDINEQKKREMLAKGNGGTIPDKSGSIPPPGSHGSTQNQNLTAGQKLLLRMQRDGIAV